MTVNPGWGGQPYIPASDAKIAALRERMPEGVPLEVDGGIDPTTAGPAAAAGATLFVAGSSVFGQADPAAAYRAVVEAADAVL
jgi:ribulose-phosphate 3-epimerase